MPNQDQFPKEGDKSNERPTAGDKDRGSSESAARQASRGDGPARIGLNSDDQPDLVSPSGVNQRDHGIADDQPSGGGALDFDDGDIAHPYGNTSGTGRTWDEKNPSDSGELGAPNVGMSDHNGPSDPDAKRRK